MTVLEDRVGHGRLGFRSALRLFDDLTVLPVYEKRVLLDCSPSLRVETWAADQNNTYSTAFERRFDDVILDVVAVEATGFPPLMRVESLALCRATAGSFYYEIFETEAGPATWDDGVTVWDGPDVRWDTFSFLFIHLPDGSNPNQRVVSVRLGFHFSNRGIIEPTFGRDLMPNGSFEDGLAGWTTSGAGLASVDIETVDPIEGTSSAKWILAATSNNFRDLDLTLDLVAGVMYRLDGLYLATLGSSIKVLVRGPDGNFIQENGREPGSPEPNFLAPESGFRNVRRFVLDFRAWASGPYTMRLRGQAPNNPTPVPAWDDGATVWDGSIVRWDTINVELPILMLDRVRLRPLFRFNYHEPRVTSRSLPQVASGSRDVFFATQQLGTGNIGLANGDGYFDSALALFGWEQTDVPIQVGGAFADTGREELLKDDYRVQFKGIIRRDLTDDANVSFSLEDVRGFVARNVPFRVYDPVALTGLDPAAAGKPRPIWFGSVLNIAPAKIGITGLLYGIYELADPDFLPNGITSVQRVYSYTTSQAASQQDDALRIQLVAGTHYVVDLALARVSMLEDVQVIIVTAENGLLDWNEGAGALSAAIAPGLYTPGQLATAAALAFNSIGAINKSVAYDQTTKKFTIARGSGTFTLLTQTGANRSAAAWSLMGFNTNVDRTGALSYVADNSIFVSVEKDHFIRVDGVGARDTIPDGRFTGTSGDPIQRGADIVRVIWELFLGQDPALIDEASFITARTAAPQPLGVYVGTTESVTSIFQKLQNSNRANIVIDGDGRIRYIVNQPGVAAPGTPVVEEVDIIRFDTKKEIDDVHGTIRILFGRNATSGVFQTATVLDPETAVRYKRPSSKEFTTYLTTLQDATLVGQSLLEISAAPPRKVELTIKGLVELVEGEKIIIDRLRGVDSSGSLSQALYRVLSIRKSPQEARTEILAVEDL